MARRESPRVVIDLRKIFLKFETISNFISDGDQHNINTYRLFMSESGKGLERIIAK